MDLIEFWYETEKTSHYVLSRKCTCHLRALREFQKFVDYFNQLVRFQFIVDRQLCEYTFIVRTRSSFYHGLKHMPKTKRGNSCC